MKIGIIGKGTVGKAVYEGLEYLGHNMCFYDPAYEGSRLADVLDAECVFLSVPTNQADKQTKRQEDQRTIKETIT